MPLDQERTRRKGSIYPLLLLLSLLVMVSFAFPHILLGHLGYALIALLLTQLVMLHKPVLRLHDRLYQVLGVVAILTQMVWLLTPVQWYLSAIPLVVSWSLLGSWSVVRLVKRLAREQRVNSGVLMGAAAGYLLLGLISGLVMIGVETIQPGSFEPIGLSGVGTVGNPPVLQWSPVFSKINYFAFICLTTVGFGDITPVQPIARMLAVTTAVVGQLYLAVVMGILIGRFSSVLRKN